MKGLGIEFGRAGRETRPEKESRTHAKKLQQVSEVWGSKNVLMQVSALK